MAWDSNPEPIKSPTRCQRLVNAATFKVWSLAQSREDKHCSLMTPERVLRKYNEDFYFIYFFVNYHKTDSWSYNCLTFSVIIRSIY